MLALQLVIGVGIALLFPLLIYTGAAISKPRHPKRSSKPIGNESSVTRRTCGGRASPTQKSSLLSWRPRVWPP